MKGHDAFCESGGESCRNLGHLLPLLFAQDCRTPGAAGEPVDKASVLHYLLKLPGGELVAHTTLLHKCFRQRAFVLAALDLPLGVEPGTIEGDFERLVLADLQV